MFRLGLGSIVPNRSRCDIQRLASKGVNPNCLRLSKCFEYLLPNEQGDPATQPGQRCDSVRYGLSGGALKGTSRRRFKRYQFWLLIEHSCELVLFGLHFFGIGAGGRFGTF